MELNGPVPAATNVFPLCPTTFSLPVEGSFLYLSLGGRTVATSSGLFANMWQEYAKADARWAHADSTVVSLEVLTVLGAGPLAAYICYQFIRGDAARHYWIVVLCTAELYGGFMTFGPEWLTGSKVGIDSSSRNRAHNRPLTRIVSPVLSALSLLQYLNTSNWLFLWVYLFVSDMAKPLKTMCVRVDVIVHYLPPCSS